MGKTNRDIGKIFSDGGTGVSQNGTFSSRRHNDIVFAYSYSTPIAAIKGETVLVTVNRYSMTTSSKHMPQLHGSRGTKLPTTEKVLRSLSDGTMKFPEAIKIGEAMALSAQRRAFAAGVPLSKLASGRYSVRPGYERTDMEIRKNGHAWELVRVGLCEDGVCVETLALGHTLKDARVLAWQFVPEALQARGYATLEDVPAPVFKKARR